MIGLLRGKLEGKGLQGRENDRGQVARLQGQFEGREAMEGLQRGVADREEGVGENGKLGRQVMVGGKVVVVVRESRMVGN